jgi:hypothetical protein
MYHLSHKPNPKILLKMVKPKYRKAGREMRSFTLYGGDIKWCSVFEKKCSAISYNSKHILLF